MDTQSIRLAVSDLQAAMARKNRAGVNEAAKRLVAARATLGRQWKAIASVLQHNGEYALARQAAAVWSEQSAGDPDAAFEQAAIYAQTGMLDQSSRILQSLPADVPTPVANAYLRGTVATNAGRLDEAREQLRRAVAAYPASGQAWLALSMAGTITADDMMALESAGSQTAGAPALERAAYLYALGRSFGQQGDHDRSFKAFDEGARLMRGANRYSQQLDVATADAAKSGWQTECLVGGSEPPSRAIFVTGLPRSGTTLVEQILASHSAVGGGEEMGLFRLIEQDVGGKSRHHLKRYTDRGGSPQALRELYDHLLRQRFGGDGLVVDKTLNASRYMGMIAGLFPEAPIIWVRRDPLDCAWSAYRTWFLRGLGWSWSLTDIAAHFQIEDALYNHWTALLGERILTVNYAELVGDPEPQIKRLAAHCGLTLELQQLKPHEVGRAVTTASVTQVREPINRKGIGSAEPYREYLKPFIDAYYGG